MYPQGFAVTKAANGYIPRGLDTFPKSYAEARERFLAWRDNPRRQSDSCKLAHNTTLEAWDRASDGATVYAVKYHRTYVVELRPDGSRVVGSGGWQTFTTRDRINRAGVRMSMAGGIASVDHGGRAWTFADGMTLNADGTVTYWQGTVEPDPDKARKARRRNLARARRQPDAYPWTWENRSGGRAHGGNAPEAFGEAS